MDLFADLTPAQREAVAHVDGPLLVLAGAGSGKTRVITRRIANLLTLGVPSSRILALTFTNKAAAEMRERVAHLVPDSEVWLGTFHAFCTRVLRRHGHLMGLHRGFSIYDQSDRMRAIKTCMEELGLDNAKVSPDQVESRISRLKNDMIGPEQFSAPHTLDHVAVVTARVYPAYQQKMLASSAVDFDDLLIHVVALLRNNPNLRSTLDDQYQYILVDEYQDTNTAQYAIIRALSTNTANLCVTGDPDQSIYGWRGANLGNILDFEHDFPGCKVVTLERNYRSTKNILRVADHLIRFNRKRKAKGLSTENPEGAPVELAWYDDELAEAHSVAERIERMAGEGHARFREIAIFVRVSSQTRPIEAALRAANIPYQVVGGPSFYERLEIKDLTAYLSLIVNPNNDVAFERVINVPIRGLGATSLERLSEYAHERGISRLAAVREAANVPQLKDRARAAFRDFVMLLDELAQVRDASAEAALRRVLSATGYQEHVLGRNDEKSLDRAENIHEFVAAARQFDVEHRGATVVDFLEDVSLASAVDRWNEGTGAVAVMTLHAAKGLEFPFVFLLGMEQGILPHHRARDDNAQLEEERRLLFVGITRAQRELYLSHCQKRTLRGQESIAIPSSFLRELPEEPVQFFDRRSSAFDEPPRTRAINPVSPPPPLVTGFRLTTAADLQTGNVLSPPSNLDAFQPGVFVIHPQLGTGRITAVEGAGPQRKGRVAFTVGRERTFVLAQSSLRVVAVGGLRTD
jgi:DNA helicase-2/ATP-dependent DNA helicase PcrA